MKRFSGAIAALALGATPASAQTLSDWGVEDMRSVLTAAGASVREPMLLDNQIVVPATSPGGVSFLVFGMECSGAGMSQRCTGAEFTASFDLETDEAVQTGLRKLDFAAVSYFNGGEGKLRVTRYIIFDHGIARDNLKVNAEVYMSLAEQVRTKLDE